MLAKIARNVHYDVSPAVELKVSSRNNVHSSVCIADKKFYIIQVVSTPHPEVNLGNGTNKRNLFDCISVVVFLRIVLWINFQPVVTFAVIHDLCTKNFWFRITVLVIWTQRIRHTIEVL